MKRGKKAMLAAGLLAGAAALSGCSAGTAVKTATPTPAVNEQATAAPSPDAATPEADASPDAGEAPTALRVGGKEADARALHENGTLLLPLIETGELLGWTASEESQGEDEATRRSIALEKDGSRITVAWVVSDNTIRQITWQRDGLLVPVDAALTSAQGVIYAPAAFFEEAMGARVSLAQDAVEVLPPEPKDTPATAGEEAG